MSVNFLGSYFGKNKTKKAVYFFGKNASIDSLYCVFDTHQFEECLLVLEEDNLKDKIDFSKLKNTRLISYDEALKFAGIPYVFDHFDSAKDLNVSVKNVVGLFGIHFNTYKLWQHLRETCENIVLAKELDDVRYEVLNWEKNPDNDVELSVILPTYNVEKYLDKCLETLTKWDSQYVEYLFVNDGSKDNSADVVEKWAKKDKRVKVLNKENGGCASARQYGIEHSKGKYIGFIDPDDFIDPTMYEKLHSRAMTGNYQVAYSGYYEFYEDTQTCAPISDLTGDPYIFGTADRKLIDELISNLRVAIWRGIYHRDLFEKCGIKFFTELRRFDDLPFKVLVYSKASSVVSVNEPLYYYRLGRAGQDVSANDERLYVHFEIFKLLDEFFKNASTNQKKKYYKVKVQTHYWALTILKKELVSDYLQKAADDLEIKNEKRTWVKLLKKYYRKKDVKVFKKCMKKKGK